MNKNIHNIIAIDGTAASGKGTIAKYIAQQLDYIFFSTGYVYRSLAFLCMQEKINYQILDVENTPLTNNTLLKNEENSSIDYSIATTSSIENAKNLILNLTKSLSLNKIQELQSTHNLDTAEVGEIASMISTNQEIRAALIDVQRSVAKLGNIIVDGRDVCNTIFPNANCKFFLDAPVTIRAERRLKQLKLLKKSAIYSDVLEALKKRDARDKERAISPLIVMKDTYKIDTSQGSCEEISENMIKIIEKCVTKI